MHQTDGVVAQLVQTGEAIQIYRLPDATLPPEIQLNGGTFVTVIGRTENNAWMNIQIPGSISGWLPSDKITILTSDFEHSQLPMIPVDEETILSYSLLWNFETNHNLVVFQRARDNGRQMNGFVKVGDSITASRMYLTPLGEGIYDLSAYPHLQHVLDYFGTDTNSAFSQASVAVRNGWSTNDVLSMSRAVERGCPTGSTPMTCEYDRNPAAFALIMLGTNDAVVMTVDEFETNLETIVETTLSYNMVPILFTIPPIQRSPYDETPFNYAIIRVSQKYDVSVVNYWLAVQPLPNQGISSDQIHPSGPPSNAGTTLFTPEYLQYGYTMRNLVTLQGLDMLLRNAVYPTFG
jgi:hypothetical protein